MRKLIIILLLVPASLFGRKLYIDESGVDDVGRDGSVSQPWATVAYAVTRATMGDTIVANAGEYVINIRVVTPVGVSFMGDPSGGTIFYCTHRSGSEFTFHLSSGSVTSGNQSFSYIEFDGVDYAAYGAIMIERRSDVTVHHCTFRNFYAWGVRFYVSNTEGTLTPTYAYRNRIHNCTLTNCAGWTSTGFGAIGVDGQDTWQVDNNTIIQDKDITVSGMPIKGVPGIVRNGRINHNKIYMLQFTTDGHWDFAIEFWDYRGNVEIDNNYMEGAIDIGGYYNFAEVGNYSVWIHDNWMGQKSQALSVGAKGVTIEGTRTNKDIIFERNYVQYTAAGFKFGRSREGVPVESNNIRISYNVFYSIGLDDSMELDNRGWGLQFAEPDPLTTMDNFEVYNNVFTGKEGSYSTQWGLQMPGYVSTNIKYINNIIVGFDNAPVTVTNWDDPLITCNGFNVENNIFYNCGNSNAIRYYYGYTPDNQVVQNNIASNPMLSNPIGNGDFTLESGSPAINAGINVGLDKDFRGWALVGLPDIGAYEYGAVAPTPPAGGFLKDTSNVMLRSVEGTFMRIE